MASLDYHRLRQQLKIEDILQRMHWHSTETRGSQRRGPCPLCGNASHSSPSSRRCFSVNFTRHVFRCFRCHRQGNALDLWAYYRQLPLHEAANQLLQLLYPTSSNRQPPPRQPPH